MRILVSSSAWLVAFLGIGMSATWAGMQDHPSIVEDAEDLPNFVPGRQQLRRALQFAPRTGGVSGQVTMSRLVPHWSNNDRLLWYRKELPEGTVEFIAVDTELGTRRPAFDHARLASSLTEAGVSQMAAERLAIREIGWDAESSCWVFRAGNRYWSWTDERMALTELTERPSFLRGQQIRFGTRDIPTASARTGPETHVTIVNETPGELYLYWRDANGERREYGTIAAGESRSQHTFAGHVWEITDSQGRSWGRFMAGEEEGVLEVTGVAPPTQRGQRDAGQRERAAGPRSPDGRWTYTIRDYNLFVSETGGELRQVSFDGSAEARYEMPQWAPDSRALVAFRVTPASTGNVFLVESSPAGGGRAELRTNAYHLPGDPFPTYELNLFAVESWEQVKPSIDRMEFGRPRLRWYADGHRFRYRQVDRGHQRFRVIEVDAHTGSTRNLIDERSETFIWTAHSERPFYHEIGDEAIIYSSERDGWNHLYWVDVESGEIRQLTRGEHVVRGIDRVDESARQIWYRVSGLYAEQDPYFIHHCRIDFEGNQFTALTDGNGTHSLQFSTQGRYYVDTYSRPDSPPVHELRRADTGSLVCHLDTADASDWLRQGGQMPEVFVAKGRDGITDIWGVIWRPVPFDPQFKYPVIEDIYAGPHDSHVPKSFSASRRYPDLTDLGFVVVKIDGMGTANRSKAFHDVCWQNLKDAGFPDRRMWHEAAASSRPWYDVSRVGIYGTSAGGQNAAGAVIFHGDFYRAAMASCGCHDNRMDKSSWNEQWMGYPVGPHYSASSNIDNASRLQGKLLLIVGELDTNVPPESTYRFVDALIKAGKDFEYLMIPGMGHSDGGPYGRRRMRDFFIRHLHGIDTSRLDN